MRQVVEQRVISLNFFKIACAKMDLDLEQFQ